MIPFRVQCETCQSRLRVRDASVVGQVHACPKCGSMVHLVPPPDHGVGSAVASASAAPKPTNAATESVLIPPTPAAPASAATSTPDFGEVEQLEPPTPAPAAKQEVFEPAIGSVGDQGNPLVVAPAEASARWIGLATAGVGTTLFVVAGLAYVLTRGGEEATEVAAVTEPPAVLANEAATPPASEAPKAEPAVPEPVKQEAFKPPVATAEPELPELPTVEPPLPPAIEEPAFKPPANVPDKANVEEAPVTPDPQTPPIAAAPFDPLDFDAASLDLILTRGGPAKKTPPEQPASRGPEPQTLLDERLAANAGMPPADVLLDGRLEGRVADARALVRRGPTGPAPPAVSDPLTVVVPEIQLADAPLDRVLRLLADVAGVGLTLPPESLQLAGVAADTSVSVRGANATIGELFDQVLGPKRLEVEQQAAGLIVRRVGGDKRRTSSYRVDDLAWPAGNDGAIAELITELLPDVLATPGASVSSADGRLTVDGPAAAHMRVAILCERIRKARGLPQQSRYPAALLAVDPPHAELKSVMSRPTTFSFVAFTPLAEVIDYWRQATGLMVLVDNAAMAEIDLRPTTTLACSVQGRPWGEALDAVLGELGLVWRAVDARTIEITTAQAADARGTVEFYLAATPAIANGLKQATAGSANTFYDENGRTLIVRASDAVHRSVAAELSEQ